MMTDLIRILEQMLLVLEDDHWSCNLELDEECDQIDEAGFQIKHYVIRQARQSIAESKDNKLAFCDDCGSSRTSFSKTYK